jgi:hypothetical protein
VALFFYYILLIVVGLIRILIIWNLKKDEFPLVNISVIIILILVVIIYSGLNYFGSAQVYGGIIGIIIQATSILFSKLKY